MRKLSLFGTVVATLAAALALPVRSPEAQEPITVKIATIAPENTPWEKQLKNLKRHLESKSGGRLKVKLFMGGSLGGEKALVRRCSQGTIQIVGVSTGAAASLVPELNVIELPYLFDSEAQADRALDSVGGRVFNAALEKRGFGFMLWAENGFRSLYTKGSAVQTVADLAGRRMRSQESAPHINMYKAFGAEPVPIDATNVLTSLQTGVVEGFDNTPLFAFASSWYQAAEHVTLTEHIYQPGIVMFSKEWHDTTLPEDLRPLFSAIPAEMVQEGRNAVRAMNPILIKNLERAGLTVHRLSAAQRSEFATRAKTSWNGTLAKSGPTARAILKQLQSAR